jgi:hypothetical protein
MLIGSTKVSDPQLPGLDGLETFFIGREKEEKTILPPSYNTVHSSIQNLSSDIIYSREKKSILH